MTNSLIQLLCDDLTEAFTEKAAVELWWWSWVHTCHAYSYEEELLFGDPGLAQVLEVLALPYAPAFPLPLRVWAL